MRIAFSRGTDKRCDWSDHGGRVKLFFCSLLVIPCAALAAADSPLSDADRARLERGRKQVAAAWRSDDGSEADRNKLVNEELAASGPALDGVFARFEETLEQLDGHFLEIQRALS